MSRSPYALCAMAGGYPTTDQNEEISVLSTTNTFTIEEERKRMQGLAAGMACLSFKMRFVDEENAGRAKHCTLLVYG